MLEDVSADDAIELLFGQFSIHRDPVVEIPSYRAIKRLLRRRHSASVVLDSNDRSALAALDGGSEGTRSASDVEHGPAGSGSQFENVLADARVAGCLSRRF